VTGDSKKAQLYNLARSQSDFVVTMSDGIYDFYMTETPRPYSVVVLFTANHARYGCTICKNMVSEFRVLAASYKQTLGSGMRGDEIFFAMVDIDSAKNTFGKFSLSEVPKLFVVPPSSEQEPPYEINPKRQFFFDSAPDADKMARFVNQQLGVKINITRSVLKALMSLCIFVLILVLSIKPIVNNSDYFLAILRKKAIWMVVSLGLYTTSISGMIYDIIRNPPPFYLNPQAGQIIFFHPESNQQFVVEGFFIGFLNVACAVALICLVSFVKWFKTTQNRSCFIGVCCVLFAVLFHSIIALYQTKNRWYMRMMG